MLSQVLSYQFRKLGRDLKESLRRDSYPLSSWLPQQDRIQIGSVLDIIVADNTEEEDGIH